MATAVIFIALITGIIKSKSSVNVKIELYFTPVSSAETVSVVGDFNNWDINSYKLVKQDSKWVARLTLKPGRYQYMFVIDGKSWMPDPNAVEYVHDGFGNRNSVLDTTFYIETKRSKKGFEKI